MSEYFITLLEKKLICENTYTFIFKKEAAYNFTAGQHAHFTLTIPAGNDEKGNTRPFSFANSPAIKDKLMIAARTDRSIFVKNLLMMDAGEKVIIGEPAGDFVMHDEKDKETVFIAGGIGITPVRSIIEDLILKGSDRKISLFYSNRKITQAAFLEDFEGWSADNQNLNFIPVITESSNSLPDNYERGQIDEKLLRKYLDSFNQKVFYIVGPPLMVNSIYRILINAGVEESLVKVDPFILSTGNKIL